MDTALRLLAEAAAAGGDERAVGAAVAGVHWVLRRAQLGG